MTDYSAILQPAVALMIWTMIIWAWMYVSRIPAMQRVNMAPDDAQVTSLLDEKLPRETQWKAHNYNHLHEQPTIFYAVIIVLALIGGGTDANAFLAWIYVGLRVIHSIVQVTANKVAVRFVLYALSSVALIVLIAKAAILVFAGAPVFPAGALDPTTV
ncbi:MAG: MAPEG family protein [Erythrobacter sp.]|jgi:hypothetical protein|nr:MAPEG family protein [Erythrobacter sp.]